MKTASNRILSLLMTACLVLGMIPLTAAAEASGCTHDCADGTCGYTEAAPCNHDHDTGCGWDGEAGNPCAHDCADGSCGYTEAAPCNHGHDENCGGLAPGHSDTEPDNMVSIITAFAPLAPEVFEQTVPLGTSVSALTLPGTLAATGTDAGEETDITVSDVTWRPEPEYRPDTPGTYAFTAVLPQGYGLAEAVSLPAIAVTVTPVGPPANHGGSIGGMLWLDMFEDIDSGVYMGDSVRQAEEQPLAGYAVSLYAAGDLENAAATATTGADGSYAFTGLEPGSYVAGVAAAVVNGEEYLPPLWYLDGNTGDNRFAAAYDPTADAWLNAYTAPIEIGADTAVTGMDAGMRTPPAKWPMAADVPYLDANGQQQTCSNATDLASGGATTLTAGWYLASGTLNYTGTITVSGDVHLILENGCSLTVTTYTNNAGILVTETNSLTVYAQSTVPGTMGVLKATGGGDFRGGSAGIGGGADGAGGNITITGGDVTATGGNSGAGIGGGYGGAGGNITITGGDVTAIGDDYAAGIGGGFNGAGGNILIYGESTVVTAKKGTSAPNDIGAGHSGAPGNVFVALPQGNLKNASGNTGNAVEFTANPASTDTVTATLPTPFETAGSQNDGTVNLLTGLDTAGKTMSVLTTFGDSANITFALAGYVNSPVTKTGTELMDSDARVSFGQADSFGLIFNVADGKFYLNIPVH